MLVMKKSNQKETLEPFDDSPYALKISVEQELPFSAKTLKVLVQKELPLSDGLSVDADEVADVVNSTHQVSVIQGVNIADNLITMLHKEVQEIHKEVVSIHTCIHEDKESVGVLTDEAKAAGALASQKAQEAKTYSESASTSASQSSTSAANALASERAAAVSEDNAELSKQGAEAAEAASLVAETSAKNAASASQASADDAKDAELLAEQFAEFSVDAKEAAELAADVAMTSKETAMEEAKVAVTKATEAAASASSAKASQNASKLSETNSKASELLAKESEILAVESAEDALASKEAAKTSETNAKASETLVTNAANSASSSATSASTSASNASTSEDNAAESEAVAVAAKESAKASEVLATNAATTATNAANTATSASSAAATSANSAEASADRAEEIAASLAGGLSDGGAIDLSSGSYPEPPVNGTFWKVTVGGVVNGVEYSVGDTLVFSLVTGFYKIDNTESVSSVNGQKGVVSLDAADVGAMASGSAYLKSESDVRYLRVEGTSGNDINSRAQGLRRNDPSADNPENAHFASATYGNGGNVTGQLATHFTSGKSFVRSYNSAWSPWAQIYTSLHKPTASELGVVNKAGDTMTGKLVLPTGALNGLSLGNTAFLGTAHSNRFVLYSSKDNSATSSGWLFRSLEGGMGKSDAMFINHNGDVGIYGKATINGGIVTSNSISINEGASAVSQLFLGADDVNRWHIEAKTDGAIAIVETDIAARLTIAKGGSTTLNGHLSTNSLQVNTAGGVGTRFGSTTWKALVGVSSTTGEYLFGGSDSGSTAFSKYIRLGSSGKLEYTDGSTTRKVYHEGHTPTLDEVQPLTTISKTLTVTNNWIDTGIESSNLQSGSYLISVATNHAANGLYSETFTGVMTWYSGGTNSNNACEILLHNAGHSDGDRQLFLRTLAQSGSAGGKLKLQISASHSLASTSYTFKFRKLI